MLQQSDRHPLQQLSLKNRVLFLEEQLASLPLKRADTSSAKHLDLLFTGIPTLGHGIDLAFLGEALKNFQNVYRKEFTHNYDIESLKRLPSGAAKLEVEGTVRGSFGVRLKPLELQLSLFESDSFGQTLKRIANLFTALKSGEEAFHHALDEVSFDTVAAARDFVKHLKQNNAGLKLANDVFRLRLNSEEIAHASTLTDTSKELVKSIVVECTFKGLLVDSRNFELFDRNNQKIKGQVDTELTEAQLQSYNELTNQRCEATLKKTTLVFPGGKEKTHYTLLRLLPENTLSQG